MAAPMSLRGKTISCNVCERSFKALKRCKSCKSAFYCSRECQIHDWPTHKLKCTALKDQSEKETSDHPKETEGGEIETVTLQKLTLDEQTCKDEKQTSGQLGDNAKSLLTYSTQESPAEQLKETRGSLLEPDLAELECSTSTEDSIRNHVTITVKTSRQKHCITLERQSPGANLMADISRTVCIPHEQMKLIHKGKLMNADNIQETIADRAVFQAIGEVAENEEGLSNKEIACVMNQIKVDRNTAIKALRKTGNSIDAILYLGNK